MRLRALPGAAATARAARQIVPTAEERCGNADMSAKCPIRNPQSADGTLDKSKQAMQRIVGT
jgi:hypothetical protein